MNAVASVRPRNDRGDAVGFLLHAARSERDGYLVGELASDLVPQVYPAVGISGLEPLIEQLAETVENEFDVVTASAGTLLPGDSTRAAVNAVAACPDGNALVIGRCIP